MLSDHKRLTTRLHATLYYIFRVSLFRCLPIKQQTTWLSLSICVFIQDIPGPWHFLYILSTSRLNCPRASSTVSQNPHTKISLQVSSNQIQPQIQFLQFQFHTHTPLKNTPSPPRPASPSLRAERRSFSPSPHPPLRRHPTRTKAFPVS